MTNNRSHGSRGRYLQDFVFTLLCFTALVVLGTGVVAYLKGQGTDYEVVQQEFWGLAIWYVLDVHVVFGFLAAAAVLAYLITRLLRRGAMNTASPVKRVLAGLAAIIVSLLIAQWIVDQHPILVDTIRATDYPSSRVPDGITLTWSGDPKTTQTVQWRTSDQAETGVLRYRSAGTEAWTQVESSVAPRLTERLANDQEIARHTVELNGLQPATRYEYQVGFAFGWTATHTFTTAPADPVPFQFGYIGDSQEGLLDYGALMEKARERFPQAAFWLHAGDLVNRGCDRDDWDLFFHASRNVFSDYTLVPAIGNHDDCDVLDPRLYTDFLELPKNGSDGVPQEHSYSYTYGEALFVVLNSNLSAEAQAPWLEETLKNSTATWKFTLWHHPAYASKENRDNEEVREYWVPLLDKYKVDIAFQGHDHAYMRTFPMRDNEIKETPAEGTIYLVAVSGTKYYDQVDRDYMAVGFEELSTYQIIDLEGKTLSYKAYDIDGKVVDEFTIEKP
jgi:hypothetical protein